MSAFVRLSPREPMPARGFGRGAAASCASRLISAAVSAHQARSSGVSVSSRTHTMTDPSPSRGASPCAMRSNWSMASAVVSILRSGYTRFGGASAPW